jgi:hypothetical protein
MAVRAARAEQPGPALIVIAQAELANEAIGGMRTANFQGSVSQTAIRCLP